MTSFSSTFCAVQYPDLTLQTIFQAVLKQKQLNRVIHMHWMFFHRYN